MAKKRSKRKSLILTAAAIPTLLTAIDRGFEVENVGLPRGSPRLDGDSLAGGRLDQHPAAACEGFF